MLRRDAAQAGDRLWISGSLGEAALGWRLQQLGACLNETGRIDLTALEGAAARVPRDSHLAALARRCVLAHRRPVPRLDLGTALGRRQAAGVRIAALDVSDGLLKDARRLATASGLSLEIDASALHPPRSFDALSSLVDRDPWSLILYGGEDYELLFTLPPSVPAPAGCRPLGWAIDAQREALVVTGAGPGSSGGPGGWDHLSPAPAG